jgi:hypothetical protein
MDEGRQGGRSRPLSQSGDTGSNPVETDQWPRPRLAVQVKPDESLAVSQVDWLAASHARAPTPGSSELAGNEVSQCEINVHGAGFDWDLPYCGSVLRFPKWLRA